MKTCSVDGCENKYWAKGYCVKHYKRYKNHGDPLFTKIEMHGMTKSPEYEIWAGMKKRCYTKTNASYYRYGGRGITVCDKWKNSFLAFYKDMGKRPTDKHQIDREKNDGNYDPDNCRWITAKENVQNRSSTKMNWFMVKSLRKLSKKKLFSHRELGLIYKITRSQVGLILNNKTWKVAN